MRELKATDKITQKMTRDGAVSENLATGEVEHISSREPETELSASSEESAGAAADLALRAAEHHEKKTARKAEKADTQAVRDGSATRQRPSSRLQFTEQERADPALGKYIDRSDRAADRLDAASLDVFLSDNGIFRKRNRNGAIWSLSLSAAVFYLTPVASDGFRSTLKPSAFDPAKKDGNLSAQIISQEQPVSETAALNPDWVEWLMGFPKGWTDVSSGPPNRKESPA